jgi:hypothetical protein
MKTEKLLRITVESPFMVSDILTTSKKSISYLKKVRRIKSNFEGEFSIKIEPAGEILI